MASDLDMSLDEIIKSKKQPSGRGGGRGGRGSGSGRGFGPVRRTGARGGFRAAPYPLAQPASMVTEGAWQHDMYDGPPAAAVVPGYAGVSTVGLETGTKLYISNLDYGVSNDDIKELFSEIGELKRCSIHYDRSGRSKGTAEVVFSRKADALAAMSRYNNVQLDGKPMKIELIGSNVAAVQPVARVGIAPAMAPYIFPSGIGGGRGRGGYAGRGRGGGRGRGRGRSRKNSEPQKTQQELDEELDQYNAKKDNMQS